MFKKVWWYNTCVNNKNGVTAMKTNYDIIELTKENEEQYLAGVVELEKDVLDKMEKAGRIGQLFITGKDGIHEYVTSPTNHVMIAVSNDDKNKVISAVYITQGQVDYTYNDITKYFKCGDKYKEYIKSKYSEEEYKKALREVYIEKICAFRYARDLILNQNGVRNLRDIPEETKNAKFIELVENEISNPQNGFHEKSEIREHLNEYMSLYISKIKNDSKRYQDFYWVDFNYLKDQLSNDKSGVTQQDDELGNIYSNDISNQYNSTIEAYDKVLQYQKYKINDTTHCNNMSRYFTANTSNTIEIDTYITHPDNREKGIARVLVLEGLKKSLYDMIRKSEVRDVFLVSTLHEENLSSKYVSEFFGLKDYIFVNRRHGRDRQVHILGIKKQNVPFYIEQMEKNIAVLYGYNPNNIKISKKDREEIIKEQMEYEVNELQRLNSIKEFDVQKKYTGYIKCKESKIQSLQRLADCINQEQKENEAMFEREVRK